MRGRLTEIQTDYGYRWTYGLAMHWWHADLLRPGHAQQSLPAFDWAIPERELE